MIGICRGKVCFPVVWKLLGKAGNSNTDEREHRRTNRADEALSRVGGP